MTAWGRMEEKIVQNAFVVSYMGMAFLVTALMVGALAVIALGVLTVIHG